MIDLKKLIDERYPEFNSKPKFIQNLTLNILNKILHVKDINKFLDSHKDDFGIQFIDEVFEKFNFSYRISNKDIKKIPAEGRVIVVANHPIGSLDSLALISAIYNVRQDVKIIATDVLTNITQLREFILPFNLESGGFVQRKNINAIGEALQNEQAVIIFPAGEVSRLRFYHIIDGKWNKGALHFAKKFNSPILPILIQAKNSMLFYMTSAINKHFSRLLLAHEVFNKYNKVINLKIGDPIPAKAFTSSFINAKVQTKLLKKHVYKLARKEEGIYSTEKNIIHPVDVKCVFKEIQNAQVLGITKDKKRILLTDYNSSPNILKEIARLREITFRSVGEGSGKKLDIDKYDKYYKHIVVWDDDELEIVGSYRIGIGSEILKESGEKGFYTSSLFKFSNEFVEKYLGDSVELGRSFVQKKYWNSNALNYLWMGIGSFLAKHEKVKYMFGPVSISNSYPEEAKKMIVYFYNKWFGTVNNLVESKNRFKVPEKDLADYQNTFSADEYKQDFLILKKMIRPFGFSVPVLYKHYTELCNNDGVKFLDFGIDVDFENCIDGLIFIEVDKVKPEKQDRYINCFKVGNEQLK
jgi:putative hemolysin